MKTLTFSRQSLQLPVLNVRNGETLGESSLAFFKKEDLTMAYLLVNVPGEEGTSFPIRFEEIEMVSTYCILISRNGGAPDEQAPLTSEEYIQLLGEAICVRPGVVAQIDKVVVDAETGELLSAEAGEEMLSARDLLAIYAAEEVGAEKDRTANVLNNQQMETWVEVLAQQMSAMTRALTRMEEHLNQKMEPAAVGESPSAQPADVLLSETQAAPEDALPNLHMPIRSEAEWETEGGYDQFEFSAEPMDVQLPTLEETQDEQQSPLDSVVLGRLEYIEQKLEHIEQVLEGLSARETMHEVPLSAAPKITSANTLPPEFKDDSRNEQATSPKQTDERTAGIHADEYSLKRPDINPDKESPIERLHIDPIIDSSKMDGFESTGSGAGLRAAWSPDLVRKTEKTSTDTPAADTKTRKADTAQRKDKPSTSVFWKTSGSQVLGMSLFVAVYCVLTFFQIL